MRKYKWLVLVLVMLLGFSFGYAEDYYVKNGGDNGAAGTSDALAWETFAYARVQTYVAGDTIHFKRDDTFNTTLYNYWRPSPSGTSENYITVDAYGSGNKPIINPIETVSGSWTLHDTNIWKKAITSDGIFRVWLDGVESAEASAIGNINSTVYLWYEASNILYVYSTQNPDDEYSTVEVIREIKTFLFQDDSYWKIQNLELRGAIFFYHTCSYIEINNVDIHRAYRGLYAELTGDSGYTVNHVTVDGCDLDGKLTLISKVIAESEVPIQDGIVLMKACSNWTITNNTIRDWGHSAIDIYSSDAAYAGCQDNVIEYNKFYGNNSPYVRAFGCVGFVNKTVDNIFRYNYIEKCNVRTQIGGNNTQVYYNIFYDIDDTTVTNKSNISQGIWLETWGSYIVDGCKIYNNVLIDVYNVGICFTTSVVNCLIKNNIVINCGQPGSDRENIQVHFYAGVANSNVISHNDFYDADTPDTVRYKGTNYTVAYADANFSEFSNNLAFDPRMIDSSGSSGLSTETWGENTSDDHNSVTEDTHIQGGTAANTNFNNSEFEIYLKGNVDPEYARKGLLSFDLSAVIGTVTNATITLHILLPPNDNMNIELWSCDDAFVETTATWNNYDGSNSWTGTHGKNTEVDTVALTNEQTGDIVFNDAALTTYINNQAGSTAYFVLETDVLGKQVRFNDYGASDGDRPSISIAAGIPSHDFTLLMASPCIDKGTDVGLVEDYQGLKIRHAPDIGAHENQTNALFSPMANVLGINVLFVLGGF